MRVLLGCEGGGGGGQCSAESRLDGLVSRLISLQIDVQVHKPRPPLSSKESVHNGVDIGVSSTTSP